MCGIVGCAGNLNNVYLKVFRDMHLLDTVRGIDSSGLVAIPIMDADEPLVAKALGGPTNLWEYDQKNFDKRGVLDKTPKIVIGHNRAATMGDLTEENAHPFSFGSTCGVHNGTLHDWNDINPDKEFKIDSQALINSIDKVGIKKTWSSFMGAATVVWYDGIKKTLNMARNEDRPMYICENVAKDVLFFASEPWMITQAAALSNVALSKEDGHSMRYLRPHTHYEFLVTPISCKMGEINQLEKKSYRASSHTSTGWVSPYEAHQKKMSSLNPPRKSEASSKSRLNEGWASGTKVASKNTRGVNFKITGRLPSGYFTCKVLEGLLENNTVWLVPKTYAQIQFYLSLIGTVHTLQSEARMRLITGTAGKKSYKISGDDTKCVLHPVDFKPDKETSPNLSEGDIYTGPTGKLMSLTRWQKMVSKPVNKSCDCCWCGDPLDPKDHKGMVWLTDRPLDNEVVCSDCASHPETINYLTQFISH
jgi:hypothetical protein